MSLDFDVLVNGRRVDTGIYIITEICSQGKPKYLHFNNYKTNKNSVIVPIEEIKKILNI